MKRLLNFLGVVMVLSGSVFAQASLDFSSSVNKTTIGSNESVTYVLEVKFQDVSRVPAPKLPDLDGKFSIQSRNESTSFAVRNGAVSSSKRFQFRLLPQKKGTLVIPAATISFDGKTYRSQPITVTVTTANPNVTVPHSRRPPRFSLFSGDMDSLFDQFETRARVRVVANAVPDSVVVGQEIRYVSSLFSTAPLIAGVQFNFPEFQGVLVEDLEQRKEPYTRQIQGQSYYVYDLVQKSLFPIKAGTISIAPMQVAAAVDAFSGRRTYSSNAVEVEVKPLPSGAPDSFNGAVGQFNLKLIERPATVNQGEPSVVRIELFGDGNLRPASELLIEDVPGLKMYKSKVDDTFSFKRGVEGKRTFEYIIVPQESGTFSIPSFKVAFFDPKAMSYETLKTEPFTIQVDAVEGLSGEGIVKQEVSSVDSDIRYIKDISRSRNYRFITSSPLFLGIAVVQTMCFFGVLGFWGYRLWMRRNPLLMAQRQAYSVAKVALKDEVSALQLQGILQEFISSKLGYSIAGYPVEKLDKILADSGVESDLRSRISALVERVAFIAFSPSSSDDQQLSTLKTELDDILAALKSWTPQLEGRS